jgi:hypothetical protein
LKDKHQHTTKCINHLADSAKFKGVTFNKICVSLKGSCFQSPNDTIHVTRYRQVVEKEIHIGKSLKDEVRKLYQKKS